MLGSNAKYLQRHHISVPNYLNFEIGECILIEYDHSSESFERVAGSSFNYQYLTNSKNPILINTPTFIYLWVPESYWAEQLKGNQQLALVITEVTGFGTPSGRLAVALNVLLPTLSMFGLNVWGQTLLPQ